MRTPNPNRVERIPVKVLVVVAILAFLAILTIGALSERLTVARRILRAMRRR